MTTEIEWARNPDGTKGETWNPVTGCDKCSPGCDNCYALTMAGRLKLMGQPKYQNDGDPATSGPGFGVTCHPSEIGRPERWRKPRTVFVNSMSDLFHRDVPEPFIADVWNTMALTDRHTYQILTKRPQRMAEVLTRWEANGWQMRRSDMVWVGPMHEPLRNAWLGTSIESDRYCFRADHLRDTPAAIRFLSLEPLLGPLPSLDLTGIDWVIVGGESGKNARPMHPDWVRDIRDQCAETGTAFFFKQWGQWAPVELAGMDDIALDESGVFMTPDGRIRELIEPHTRTELMYRPGKKRAGRELDGRVWDEMPSTERTAA